MVDSFKFDNNFDELLRELNQKLASQPQDVHTLGVKGAVLVYRGEYDEAIKIYQKALDIEPDNTDIRVEQNYAFYFRKRFKAIEESLKPTKSV
jgi:cytochrome c-type biogenesis protein CcmH/NrfG